MEQSGAVSPHNWPKPSSMVWLAAILGITFLLRMNFWDQPFQMDEGVYSYMGWGMLDGLVPYKDIYDHKPPGIYVLYSLALLLFGPTALSIKIFASIYSLATVVVVFLVARKIGGAKAGCLAGLLFGIFSCGPRIEGGGVNTEIFMVLPYTLAAYSLLKAVETGERKHYLYFGIWTGVATTIKQVAIVNLFWAAAYLLVTMWRARDKDYTARSLANGVWIAVGTVLPWLPFLIYFGLHGALGKFYYWQVSFNLNYVAKGHGPISNFGFFLHRTKDVLSENGFLWLLAITAIVSQWQEIRKMSAAEQDLDMPSWRWNSWFIMATWPIFSFIGVMLGGRFFGHYYIQTIPSLAVLGGIGLIMLYQKVRAQGIEVVRTPVSLVLSLLFVKAFLLFIITDVPYYVSYDGEQISYHQYKSPIFSVTRFIGNYLRKHTDPDDLVYVWAVNPEINFYALRKTPSSYLVHRPEEEVPAEEVMQSLNRSPPKYIVVMEKMERFKQLKDYVRQNYEVKIDKELDDLKQLIPFEIYYRKEG